MKQLIGKDVGSYTFDPAAKTITFSGVSITQSQILLVTNTTTGDLLYNFADPTLGGSLSGSVLTLTYNTTSMNAGDAIQIYVDLPIPLALETGGNLAALASRVPARGAAAAAACMPVVLSTDQGSANAPAVLTNYTFTGAISAGTQVVNIDCTLVRSLAVHLTSISNGSLQPKWSNDGINWVNAGLSTPAGAQQNLLNSAGNMGTTPIYARYFGIFVNGAISSGTTTVVVYSFQQNIGQPYANSVAFTNALLGGSNTIGDVGVAYRSTSGGITIKHLVAAASTNATSVKASAGRIAGWQLSNTTASWRFVKFHNTNTTPTAGSGVIMVVGIPPNMTIEHQTLSGVYCSSGIGLTMVTGAADADATAVSANDIVGTVFYA